MKTRIQVNNVVVEWDAKHVITTPLFWDCSCNDSYIHSSRQNRCQKCGDIRQSSPDSRLEEVIENLIRLVCEDPGSGVELRTVPRRKR